MQRSWKTDGPFDLRRTLRFVLPANGPSADIGSAGGSYAVWTRQGPAMVTLAVADGSISATAVGSGAEAALTEVPRTLGLDDDPAEFDAGSGRLRDLHHRHRGMRLGSTGRVFDVMLPTVLGQRVTTDEAKGSYRRLVQTFGEPAPGDLGLTLPPRPEALAGLGYEDLHGFGVERSRAQIVIEVARRADRLEETIGMNRSDAAKRLAAVRGVGPWTIAQVMGAAWGDRDAIPRGDFHLPNTVSWVLAGEPRGDDDRMEELLEPYRPYRRRALLLLKLSGVHAPRYGPRSPKGTIAGTR